MPNLANAKKALKQSLKHQARNLIAKAELQTLRIKLRKAIDGKQLEQAQELARLVSKKMDKLHGRGIFKKNTVARYKSRFMKKVNALKK